MCSRVLFVFSCLVLASCADASGCGQQLEHTLMDDVRTSEALSSSSRDVLDVIPAKSDVLVGFRSAELIGLMESEWMQGANRSLALVADVELLSMCRDSADTLGTSLCDPSFHKSFGLNPELPVYIARHQHHWIWAFMPSHSWQSKPRIPGVRITPAQPEDLSLLRVTRATSSDERDVWSMDVDGVRVIVSPDQHFQGSSSETKLLTESLGKLAPTHRWRARQAHRKLHDHFSERAELLVISSTHALTTTTSDDVASLARRQRERMLSQLEYVGLGIWRSPDSLGRLDGELQVMTRAGEAVFVESLEPSKATLPRTLGALLSSQTLGAFHTAVEPRSLLDMWLGALDRTQREEFDKYLKYLKEDFLLDVDAAFLDNLTGHMLLVIYDVQEGDAVDPSGPSFFGLDATHEVLYMPLQDRFALEQFLNAITQLTRGRLRRQREDGIIQYVWIEDGELLGAILLGDDAVAIVDSAISANHAMAQLTSPQPLTPAQSQRFGAMFDTHQGFGVWINPTAFSTRFDSDMSQTLQGMTHFSLSSYQERAEQSDGMLGAQMSVTLATETFDEPVVGEP